LEPHYIFAIHDIFAIVFFVIFGIDFFIKYNSTMSIISDKNHQNIFLRRNYK
jgi:hypothetical protein